jgi:hypothetical protein
VGDGPGEGWGVAGAESAGGAGVGLGPADGVGIGGGPPSGSMLLSRYDHGISDRMRW